MTIGEARHDAGVALQWWAKDAQGRPMLPVAPLQIARNLGLDVFLSELEPDVSGVLVKQDGGIPTIYLNFRDALVRQRFSCAHEIGHFWRRRGAVNNFGYVDRRGILASAGTDTEEIYANRFAAELLMPLELVREFAAGGSTAETLASTFFVSIDAMRYRFANLGLS